MSEDRTAYVFIDEFGSPDLEVPKDGNEPFCVYAAVVIAATHINKARSILKSLHEKYYPHGFIKSKFIKNDAKGYVRTINTLTELKELEHYVTALVIDKAHVVSDGLHYKKSFIKFFQCLISKRFLEMFDEVHVCFDMTGDDEFKTSLELYMNKEVGFGPNLFSNNTYKALNDITEEPLIQFADFYAGTIGKYYCGRYDKNRADVIHNSFLRSRVSIEWFPPNYVSYIAASAIFDGNFDVELLSIAIESAKEYLDKYKDDVVGCELLKYLLQETTRNPLRHISSQEIKLNLSNKGVEIGDPIVKISELRDQGVFIISPIGKKGYKFPTSETEIAEFYNRLSCNVVPQLRRGFTMNKLLFEKTMGRINVMSNSEFALLLKLGEDVCSFQ